MSDRMRLVGVDVFVVAEKLPTLRDSYGALKPMMISNRGTKVWPGPIPNIELTDVFRCRFKAVDPSNAVLNAQVLALLAELEKDSVDWVHIEKLLELDGKAAYSLAQGE